VCEFKREVLHVLVRSTKFVAFSVKAFKSHWN